MPANMHFVWVQHWTALPVIIEEGRMSDNSRQPGGKLPQGQQSVGPSTGTDLSEAEGYQPSRMCCNTIRLLLLILQIFV